MSKIVTHDKKAHLDDFLSCCILAAKTDFPIYRVNWPTEEDLNDSEVYVVDFGKSHDPALKNFDHHQIKGGEQCAFTLILDYFGMRDYDALPWIKMVEVWDHCGPQKAMELVGGGDSSLIFSPLQDFCIKMFSNVDGKVNMHMREMMRDIGEHIISLRSEFSASYADLKEKSKILECEGFRVIDYRECAINPYFLASSKLEKENKIDIILNNNERGNSKLRMIRKIDIDFNQASKIEGVEFVHQSGFLICFDGDYCKILKTLTK